MPDQIVFASAPDRGIAVVAATTTELVAEAQRRHELSPTASAAVGRLMTGAALLGTSLKGRERLSLQIVGNGPLQSIVADVARQRDGAIGVRGYAKRPSADVPLNERGKFDVAAAVGAGSLQVTKSFEVGQPYVGVVPLASGEIGEDLATYLLKSEQIPSAVALGVLAKPDGIAAAGGVLAQVLPGADERAIVYLEEHATQMRPVTEQIAEGANALDLIRSISGDIALKNRRTVEVRFACRCTREKVRLALLGLGQDELLKMAAERPQTEATCEFCKKTYVLSSHEIEMLIERLKEARGQERP
ncbi:MAG: Hsp33 family molecular chaperone HslO [Candidatus Eremiobacteraeota bacterium]|nr:Hsp33 family molecular chaperone HslO [Candidatus Eremiobacteraeota bacterium]